ncbi:hypothetical protein POL68_16170 [Stigmatella sp. ncwal1]|uniref:Uncharacterized protein n=1 Tax=Stigmatella ashevillensis TaxID=2995309 RepID=A0ABT5DCF6_9BACT|nr:hypothetical protein [Stigmatella ashevillena]MDC0710012.1 hypothetical protein [Stigmatella ashevillena]
MLLMEVSPAVLAPNLQLLSASVTPDPAKRAAVVQSRALVRNRAEEGRGSYDCDNHSGKAAQFVTLTGGHNSLRLNQQACAPRVMTRIASGAADLATVLAACPLPVQVVAKESTR